MADAICCRGFILWRCSGGTSYTGRCGRKELDFLKEWVKIMKFSKLFNKLLTCDTTVNVYLVTDYIDNGFRANHVGTYVVGEEEAPERETCESSVVNICPVMPLTTLRLGISKTSFASASGLQFILQHAVLRHGRQFYRNHPDKDATITVFLSKAAIS